MNDICKLFHQKACRRGGRMLKSKLSRLKLESGTSRHILSALPLFLLSLCLTLPSFFFYCMCVSHASKATKHLAEPLYFYNSSINAMALRDNLRMPATDQYQKQRCCIFQSLFRVNARHLLVANFWMEVCFMHLDLK